MHGNLSRTQKVLSIFFLLSAALRVIVAITLLFPDTPLSGIWRIKPHEFRQLLELRLWAVLGFILLSSTMAAAAIGCLLRRRWGWSLALAIFTVNGAANVGQIVAGRVWEGFVGVIVVIAIIIWLMRPGVRTAFK